MAVPAFPVAAEPFDAPPRVRFSRRDFLRYCSVITGVLALPPSYAVRIAQALTAAAEAPVRPTVIWLELQDCAGDTESFLRSSHPTAGDFVFDLIDLAYHETLMTAAGERAEANLRDAMERAKGTYIVVVEGSIPTAEGGIHCVVGGRTGEDLLKEVAADAAALVAVGTCAAYGGIAAADPNPTGAVGVGDIVKDVPVMNLPGCPVNAVNVSAALVHFLTFGELPAMDELGRPLFAYGGVLHDSCPRRAHFDAGRFVREWGDDGHRQGWCLYRMGCKGPAASSNCPLVGWNDNTSWPIAVGHPCIACTEPGFWDSSSPMYRWMGQSLLPSPREPEDDDGLVGAALGVGAAAIAAGAGAALLARQRRRERERSHGSVRGPEPGPEPGPEEVAAT